MYVRVSCTANRVAVGGGGVDEKTISPTDILNFIIVEERCEIKMAAAGGVRPPLSPTAVRICRYWSGAQKGLPTIQGADNNFPIDRRRGCCCCCCWFWCRCYCRRYIIVSLNPPYPALRPPARPLSALQPTRVPQKHIFWTFHRTKSTEILYNIT